MKKLIIFGAGKIAEVLHYYFLHESEYQLVAFTVNKEFLNKEKKFDLPVVPFEKIEEQYPPDKYCMFVAVGYQDLNDVRKKKLIEAKEKGYDVVTYIHPNSSVPKDLVYGENCFVMNNVCIHPRVKLGDNVFVWSGAIIGHHSAVDNHSWLTSGSNIAGNVNIGESCFFAINSTVAHSVSIGNKCFVGSNSLITKNLDDNKVVFEKATKACRLNSDEFLQMSKFSNL